MRHCNALTLLLVSLGAMTQSRADTFVPQSPLTPEEAAEQKAKLKRSTMIPDADIDRLLAKDHTFHESDIVAAFPELRGGIKLSSCSNSIMSGATQIVFISDVGRNEVTVKTTHCTPVENGVSCGPVSSEKRYFLMSPKHNFALKGLTLPKAETIIEAYVNNRVDGLPDWYGTPRMGVRGIDALPDGNYRLLFGDFFCAGCGSRFDVRLDTGGSEPRLKYVGNADTICF